MAAALGIGSVWQWHDQGEINGAIEVCSADGEHRQKKGAQVRSKLAALFSKRKER